MSDMAPITARPTTRAIAEMEDLFVRSGQSQIKAESMDLRRKRVRNNPVLQTYKADSNPLAHRSRWQRLTLFVSWPARSWENAAMEAETLRAQTRPARCGFEA